MNNPGNIDMLPGFNIITKTMNTTTLILLYIVLINILTFFIYGIDKLKAKKSKWRVSENTLIGMAIIGGSIGAWLGMKIWHHKTLHKKFKYGVPLILVAQTALCCYLLKLF